MAAKSTRPSAPQIALDALAPDAFEVTAAGTCSGMTITGDYAQQEGADMDIDGCHLQGALFTGAFLPGLRLTDVIVENTDFSGADCEGSRFTRVAFRGCRLSGLALAQSQLRDVAFVDCKLDGANFRMVKAERIQFEHADLGEADFYGAALVLARFFDCDLRAAQFASAEVPEARFHGSRLDGLKGAEQLRNIVIDSEQVLALALPVLHGLGIRVEDDRETKDEG